MGKISESKVSDWTQDESSVGSNETGSELTGDKISKRTVETCIEDLEADESEVVRSRRKQTCPWLLLQSIGLAMFSTLLLILFVLAAITQRDKGTSFVLFYCLNAAVPTLFMVYWACWFPIMALHVLAIINGAWSIVYLVIAALEVQETESIEQTGLEDAFKVVHTGISQNSIIAMASLGFISSMYHSIMAERCIDSMKRDAHDDHSV